VNRLGPAITAARRDGLRIGVFIVHQLIGLGHRFDFASTPPKDPEFPFSRSEPNGTLGFVQRIGRLVEASLRSVALLG
jgi:hypothetical protein